ncbi:MAG: hypothetical protein AMXMBFR83_11120 [Phycisphaerae bacterium]
MAADYLCKTRDPTNPDGPRVEAVFSAEYTLKLYKYAPVAYENLRAAKYVLENVERIFFGVREYNEGGWCFTGRPEEWYIRENTTAPFPRNLVFAVYLNPNLRVYECRAEYADPDDGMCPRNWRDRYRGLTWKSTSLRT